MNSKRCFFFTILILFIVATVAFGTDRGIIRNTANLSHASEHLGNYRALIIGIDEYTDSRIKSLKTAVKDARSMARLLQTRYGFETEMLINKKATGDAVYNALMRLVDSAEAQDSILNFKIFRILFILKFCKF